MAVLDGRGRSSVSIRVSSGCAVVRARRTRGPKCTVLQSKIAVRRKLPPLVVIASRDVDPGVIVKRDQYSVYPLVYTVQNETGS